MLGEEDWRGEEEEGEGEGVLIKSSNPRGKMDTKGTCMLLKTNISSISLVVQITGTNQSIQDNEKDLLIF